MIHKKAVFKNLASFLCWNIFFNENASLQFCNFIKKRLDHRCLLVNIAKFLTTLAWKKAPVFKNICKRQFKRFPNWINDIKSNIWGGRFLKKVKIKQKQNSKTELDKNTCLFMMPLIISFFSISPMHFRQRFPYIRKDDSSEGH